MNTVRLSRSGFLAALACITMFMFFTNNANAEGHIGVHVVTETEQPEPQPLEGAAVVITNDGGFRREGTADSNGWFNIYNVDPGVYTIHASKHGYEEKQTAATVEDGKKTEVTMNLAMVYANVEGVIYNALNYDTVQKAYVEIIDLELNYDAEYGSYWFNLVEPGTHTMRISAPGYEELVREVVFEGGKTNYIDHFLQPLDRGSSLRVTVLSDRTGEPIEGAEVTIYKDMDVTSQREGTTGADGVHLFEGLDNGTYTVNCSKSPYTDHTAEASVEGETSVTVRLPRPDTFTHSGYTLNAEDGSRIAGVVVTIESTDLSARTYQAGAFTIENIPRGTYTVTYTHGSYYPYSHEISGEGGEITNMDIHLTPAPQQLSGTVVDGFDGSPVPGAQVKIRRFSPEPTVTGNDGSYRFEGVPYGDVTLDITHDSYQPAVLETTVGNDDRTNLERRNAVLSGIVADQFGRPVEGAAVTFDRFGLSTVSDAVGAYSLEMIWGTWTGSVSRDGYGPGEDEVYVAPSGESRHDFTLTAATGQISGRVLDIRSDSEMNDVTVSVTGYDLSYFTSTDGAYVFPEVPVGEQELVFAHPEYITERRIITFDPDDPAFEVVRMSPKTSSIITTPDLPPAFVGEPYKANIMTKPPASKTAASSASYASINFALLEGPEWMTLDTVLGMLGGTPAAEHAGHNQLVSVSATYDGLTDTLTTLIDVLDRSVGVRAETPDLFAVEAPFPNPFNPAVTIPFTLPDDRHVRVMVYDVLGRHVRTLLDGSPGPGRHHAVWDARSEGGETVAGGVYLYRVVAGREQRTGKLLYVR